MKDLSASDSRPVYHGLEADGGEVDGAESSFGHAASLTDDDLRELTGFAPRMFALIQEFVEADDGVIEVVAYGISLPEEATTVHARGRSIGRWRSAESAASRLRAHLVWLG